MSDSTRAVLHGNVGPAAVAPGRWRPAPLIRVTFILHGLGVLLILLETANWPWVLAVLACNHLLLSLCVLFPRASLLGPNLTRLPAAAAARGEVALTFDDGPDPEITPQVLDLLEAAGMRASFFCIAEKALAHPELLREILRRGHQVENHSYQHHASFSLYSYGRLAREVDAAQAALAQLAERAPRFFRAPAGFRSPLLDPVLARRGLRYVSWTRRGFDAVERDPAKVLRRLTGQLAGGDVLLLHDGTRARTPEGVPVVLAVLPDLLARLREQGLSSVPLGVAYPDSAAAGERAS